MYDDKWTEVNNGQGSQQQTGSQSGMAQAGGQDPQPVRKQVYGLSGQGQPQNQSPDQTYQQPQYQNGPQGQSGQQDQYRHSSPYPYAGQDGNGGMNGGGHGVNGGSHKAPKKRSVMKTTAMVTAAALLFGVVSGATMFGVNRAANALFPEETAPIQQTQVVQAAPQSSSSSSGGVFIEDVSPIVEAVMPSVVAITNTMLYRGSTWFGQTQTYEVPSSGSGIIVGQNDTELLVVTNNHVIEDATTLAVTFIDESTAEAAVKGTDSESDLAVIAIPLEDISADTKSQIKAATLGDSDSLKMGQGVIAIGNALGLGQSVTVGHVSALNREVTVDGVTKTVIQTDAAINPGNSGGALLNSKGEVIGINEAKYADEKVEGVGYAIPISHAKEIIDDLKNRTTKVEIGEEEQGYLGIQIQNIDSSMAKLYGMPEGVYVYKITEDSAAASSELKEKDIITKFDGETVRNYADLTKLLTYYKKGTTVNLTVQRLENGEYVEKEIPITLNERPKEEEKAEQPK